MRAIWRAQRYQLKNDKLVRVLFSVCFFGCAAYLLASRQPMLSEHAHLTISCFWATEGQTIASVLLVYTFVCTVYLFGTDYDNGTIRYEVLAGYCRRTVFRTRAWFAVVVTQAGGWICFMLLPFLYAFHGVGNTYGFGAYLLRCLTCQIFLLRVTAELILLNVVLKDRIKTGGAMILIGILELIVLSGVSDGSLPEPYSIVGAFYALFDIRIWSRMSTTGQEMIVADGAYSAEAATVLVSSVVIAGLAFSFARAWFEQDDL